MKLIKTIFQQLKLNFFLTLQLLIALFSQETIEVKATSKESL